MSRTVVAGYDGSEVSRAAVAEAAGRAGPDGTVYVVYGFGVPPDFLGAPYYERLLEEREGRGRELLDALLTERAGALPPANYEAELIGGPVADAINTVARTRKADEIVLGARGLGAVRAALGSVSQAVLRDADRPVVVIPAAALARGG